MAKGLEATKTLEFSQGSYVVNLSADVQRFHRPVAAKIAWGPGIGTPHKEETTHYEAAVASSGAKMSRYDSHTVHEPGSIDGGWVWTGAEEQYFAAVFVPTSGTTTLELTPFYLDLPTEGAPPKPPATDADKVAPPKHLLVQVPTGQSYNLYAGPKDYQVLGGLGLNLQGLVNFSYPIPLIGPRDRSPVHPALPDPQDTAHVHRQLRRLHHHPDHGDQDPVLSHYPADHGQDAQGQQDMGRLKPKADAIKKKYAKAKDLTTRNKANEEIMELYRKEGVNPMASLGGCLPLLLQLPILYAFYTVLRVSIDLRQAPFIGWIQDLSWRDPYYITPIVMGLTMFVQQKLAMTNTTDPQMKSQQRMMLFMPLFFTWTFLHLPSGLVLYWFVNNVLGIVQQVLINRQAKALEAPAAEAPGKA
jgi:YidC/Oxa1 family membrane protein insertase